MNEYERQATIEYVAEKCKKANLTSEQTAQVIDFRLDPWWCNDDKQSDVIIDFFHRLVDQQFEHDLGTLDVVCNNPLCPEHGSPLDTSIDVVRLNRTVTTCYFGCGNAATTTRTRPDGAVKNCPTCADCADLIDEQNYNNAQAYRFDPERVQ